MLIRCHQVREFCNSIYFFSMHDWYQSYVACRISSSVKRGYCHAKKHLLVYYAWRLCCPLSLQPLTGGSTTEKMLLGHKCTIKVGCYEWPHLCACLFGFRSCLPLGCGTFLGDLWKSTCRIWTRERTAVIFEDRPSNDSTCSTHTHTRKSEWSLPESFFT